MMAITRANKRPSPTNNPVNPMQRQPPSDWQATEVKPRRVASGFTLIELLVVIAVIAILAAMLLPVLARSKQKASQTFCLNSMRQLGIASVCYSGEYNQHFAWMHNWGSAWGDDHVLNPASFWMPEAFRPYVGTNMSSTNGVLATRYKPITSLFTCPMGLLMSMKVPPSSEDYGFDNDFYYANDGVSYVWNHEYWDPYHQDYGPPISGRPLARVRQPSLAVLIWEIPYHESIYMPHDQGMNVVHADGSANRIKGNPKDTDWWVSNSYVGWDEMGPLVTQ